MKGTRRGSGKKLREAIIKDAELYTITCAWEPCSKEFPMTPSVSGLNTEHYCSGECAWAAMKAKAARREQAVHEEFPPVTEADRIIAEDPDEENEMIQDHEDGSTTRFRGGAFVERPGITVHCPFQTEGAACGTMLTLEVEPEDRTVGLMGETIIGLDGECPHAALAAAEMETRDWKDLPGPLEAKLYEALQQYRDAELEGMA